MKEEAYGQLQIAISRYLSKPEHHDFIRRAYDFAYERHSSQLRKSGQPYIVHPVDVAITLAEYQVDPITIVSGLLHDILEDTPTKYDEVK
jgi:GTP diphosphokinase / guanosine-3',5'-bis(diphosphate) 3'-diphosphatase